MTVTVQVSKVLSPATLKILPLKGTSIDATFDAGSCAALHRIEKLSELYPLSPDPGKDVKSTWNRLGRAPPPISC